MPENSPNYDRLYAECSWQISARFNIADVCCNRWAQDVERLALIEVDDAGDSRTRTFRELQALTEAPEDHVKSRPAAHEYPREITWVAALSQTATGKIMRHALRAMDDEVDSDQ